MDNWRRSVRSNPATGAGLRAGSSNSGLYLSLALGFLAGLLLTACGGASDPRDETGAIVESGSLGALSLRVGDCFDDSLQVAGEFESLNVLPCSEPHDNEIYAAIDYPAGDDDTYPGQLVLREFAVETCLDAFEPYVGSSYESSRFEYGWFTPTPESWDVAGDHEVLCFLWHVERLKLVASKKDSGE